MKKNCILVFVSIIMSVAFAQNDFQIVAEVNLTKREPITVGELKLFVKNLEAPTGQKMSVEQRIEVLTSIANHKLVLQLAQKQGIKIPDSQVNEYFQYMLSEIAGQPISESQFEAQVKSQGYSSFDSFMKEQTGMTIPRFKESLRDQLTVQAYIMNTYGSKLQKIEATNAEVQQAYEATKQNLVRPDMITTFMVAVQKQGKTASEKAKTDALRSRLVANPKLTDQILKEAQKEGSGFIATNVYMYKNEETAQTLGITMPQLMEIFNLKINTVTEVKEMPNNFQFFVILAKDRMKFLGLDDKFDPTRDVTVRQMLQYNITMQKRNLAAVNAIKEVVDSVKTDKTYKILKSDKELRKLLAW